MARQTRFILLLGSLTLLLGFLFQGCNPSASSTTSPDIVVPQKDFGSGNVTLKHNFEGQTEVSKSFSGEGTYPLGASGVIAAMDSSRTSLVIWGYSKVTATAKGQAPGANYNFFIFAVHDSTGISQRTYHGSLGDEAGMILGLNIDTAKSSVDSLGYKGGLSLTIEGLTLTTVSGIFNGVGIRGQLEAVIVENGTFNATFVLSDELFELLDDSDEDGIPDAIVRRVLQGTSPVY